jgi:hypothetical protein
MRAELRGCATVGSGEEDEQTEEGRESVTAREEQVWNEEEQGHEQKWVGGVAAKCERCANDVQAVTTRGSCVASAQCIGGGGRAARLE